MKNLTRWVFIGIAAVLAGGALINRSVLEHRINAVRPLADQQVMQNAELAGKHGYNNGQLLFQSNYIEEYTNRANQYNSALPYTNSAGFVSMCFASLGGFWPRRKGD